MTTATLNILPQEQALEDAGITPSAVRLFIREALIQNVMDEVRGYLENGNVPQWDELEEQGVNVRKLILDYVEATLVIDFEGAVL